MVVFFLFSFLFLRVLTRFVVSSPTCTLSFTTHSNNSNSHNHFHSSGRHTLFQMCVCLFIHFDPLCFFLGGDMVVVVNGFANVEHFMHIARNINKCFYIHCSLKKHFILCACAKIHGFIGASNVADMNMK